MHSRELVEVAVLTSLYARPILERVDALCPDALCEYWIASRCRIDAWTRLLKRLSDTRSITEGDPNQALRQLVEDVLLSEVLTRTVAAIAQLHDKARSHDEAAMIGRNTLNAHCDARTRMTTLLGVWWARDSVNRRRLTSLARETERWTDTLLACLGNADDAGPFAHDPRRRREIAQDNSSLCRSPHVSAPLFIQAIRTSFVANDSPPQSAELNRRIAGAAIGLLGPQLFDDLGLISWPSRHGSTLSPEAALAVLESLFAEERSGERLSPSERWRL